MGFGPFAASAATVAQWTNANLDPGAAGSINATTGTGVLSRGAGVAWVTLANYYNSNSWNVATEGGTVTANNYIQFTVNATGYRDLNLAFTHGKSNTGPPNARLYYSTTGVAGAYTAANTFAPANADANASFDLSAITALNNNANVVFRFYGWNATNNGGQFRINNLLITGNEDPNISVPAALAFGSIDAATTLDQNLVVTNTGTAQTLNVLATTTITGPDAARFSIQTALPVGVAAGGGTSNVSVRFNPAGAYGNFTATLEVKSNDIGNPSVNVALTGTGLEPDVDPVPASVDFGNQDIDAGASAATNVVITNAGNATLTFTSAPSLSGDASFAISGDTGELTLAPAASRTVSVTFDPSALGGAAGSLDIATDDPDEPSIGVALSGTGIDQEIDVTPGGLSVAFGGRDIDAGASAAQTITITNTGTNTLNFTGAQVLLSGDAAFAISADSGEATLAPAASRTVDITFDPSALGGAAGTLTITSDDTTEPSVVVALSGTGVDQEIEVAPASHDFGDRDIDAGASAAQTITITNAGTNTLNFTGAQVVLAGSAAFAISADSGEASLAPAASRTVDITFDPSALGAASATLTITSDDTDEPSVVVNLDGNGIDQEIDITPVAHDFGARDVDAGASAAQTITITNAGTNALAISSVGLAGSPAFAISADSGEAVLAPAASRTVDITFNPASAGALSGTLTIDSDDSDEPSFAIGLDGTGIDQEIDIAPASHDFGNRDLDAGASAAQTITITNAGTAPLAISGVGLSGSADFAISADSGEAVLAPAASRTVDITFDPSALGAASAALTINSDDTDEPSVAVDLDGTGIDQEIDVTPAAADFLDQDIDAGATAPLTVTITNTGTNTLSFTGAEVVLAGSAAFAVSADSGEAALAPAASRTVDLTFDPTGLGPDSATLTITTDDTDEPTVVVTIDGDGVDQEIDVDATSHNFGDRDIDDGQSPPFMITITNDGTAPISFTGAEVALAGSADFSISSDSGQSTLNPNASRVVHVRFDPSATGAAAGTLVITTNDTDEPTVNVALSGAGTDQEIDVDPVSVNFGDQDVDVGVSTALTVTITNIGTAPLGFTGAQVALSGDPDFAVDADSLEGTLAPGEDRTVDLTFDPSTTGAKSGTLTITSDDSDEPSVVVSLAGNAIDQELQVTGGPLNFGSRDVDAGAGASQDLTITNGGTATLTFAGAGIEITGANATAFAFASAPSLAPLGPAESRIVSVVFDPNTPGSKSATVSVTTDGGDVNVSLAGTGIDQEITVAPLALDFGDRDAGAGASAPLTVTITNNGNNTLAISDVGLSGSAAFAIAGDSAEATLAPAESRTIDLTFDPSAAGAVSGALTIESDDTDEPSIVVALDGAGTDKEIGVSPSSLDFGNRPLGSGPSAALVVTIENTGTSALNFTGAGFAISGPDASDFAISNSPSTAPLAPGQTRLVLVTFTPSAEAPLTASLQITSDDADEALVEVTLDGVGTAAGEPGENSVRGTWKLYE